MSRILVDHKNRSVLSVDHKGHCLKMSSADRFAKLPKVRVCMRVSEFDCL